MPGECQAATRQAWPCLQPCHCLEQIQQSLSLCEPADVEHPAETAHRLTVSRDRLYSLQVGCAQAGGKDPPEMSARTIRRTAAHTRCKHHVPPARMSHHQPLAEPIGSSRFRSIRPGAAISNK